MPVYEYRCGGCKKKVSVFLRDSSKQAVCPQCGGADLKRLVSRVAYHNKANLWTDEKGPPPVGGTPKLMLVSNVASNVITLTDVGFDPLGDRDTFVVKNYLPDTLDAQEKQAIVTYNGVAYIKLGDVNWDFATGIKISSNYTPGSGNPSSADTVETALQKIDGNVDAVNSLTGIVQGGTNLGSFTGTVLGTPNQTIKAALQLLATATDSLNTLSGVALNALNLGTFTGPLGIGVSLILGGTLTIKQALQALASWLEETNAKIAKVTGVTTITTIDSFLVDNYSSAEWTVVVELVSDRSRKFRQTFQVIHDGVASGADAANVDINAYARIKVGTTFSANVTIDLNGTAAAQVVRLRVDAPAAVDVKVFRKLAEY